jgi:two-component system NtrC family sensor kinase
MDFPGMTALPQDAVADLQQRIAELERQLEAAVDERDAAIERQTASALVNFRLKNELRAATERQSASADILNAIANTRGDAEHALQRIAETTQNFFNAAGVTIRIAEGDQWVQNVRIGSGANLTGSQPAAQLLTRGANLPATVFRENRQIHIPDLDNIDPSMADWPASVAREAGIRTICGTPLRRDGKAIGALIVYRDRLAAFTDDELALQQSFADQAVIAIENARLFNDTQQALIRQDATAEILRTVASTPGNADLSLRQIAETSARLFGAPSVTLLLAENGEWTKAYRFGASSERIGSALPLQMSPVGGRNLPGRVVADDRQIHVPDLDNLPPEMADWPGLPHARAGGTRSACGTPLRREGKAIGALLIFRDRLAPFTEQELALQQSFADQAVIAIENARLFNETREALERQTATADILKVIASSPSDVQPVFEAIAHSANRLIGGFSTAVYRIVDDIVHMTAFTPTNPESDAALKAAFPIHRSEVPAIALVQDGETAQIADSELADAQTQRLGRARGWRSVTFTPLMNQGAFIGFIVCTRRETGVLGEHHVQLLRTFADQAVIAIENVRLFNETKEALERQTATADILKVIASSPSDVQPVFEAIAHSANRLLGGFSSTVFRFVDGVAHLKAFTPVNPEADAALTSAFPAPVTQLAPLRMMQSGEVLQIPDTEAADYELGEIARARGYRSMVWAPLMNRGESIGFIAVTRVQPGSFVDHHIQLLQTFADQAVIAIENTRLFNETQEALERQTATADILKVIASSPSDTTPVFEAIASSAKRLVGGRSAAVFRIIDGTVHVAAFTSINPTADAALKADFPRPVEGFEGFQFALSGKPFVIPDTEERKTGTLPEVARLHGFRSMLYVPLMNGDVPFGIITVTRAEPGGFPPHHIQLLQTFADQAVIAIENTRLFNEVEARTVELTESLQQQTATSEVLQIISSSPGDLAPVFDKMLENATRVCGAEFGSMVLMEGDMLRQAAFYNAPAELAAVRTNAVRPLHPLSGIATAVRDKRVVQTEDIRNSPSYLARAQHAVELAELGGARTLVIVPMLRDDEAIGVITVYRQEVRPFGDKQIELLTNFARQAVIAIENARLLRELRQRTDDLTEALTHQTGSANILNVIASSPTDVKPVLDVIVDSACDLCEAYDAIVLLKDGDELRVFAHHGPIPVRSTTHRINRTFTAGRAFIDRKAVHIHDTQADQDEFSHGRELAAQLGHRTVVGVPLLREGESIGVILLRRMEVHPFSEKQIALLQTFADQAVIAIGNVRLFEEVQQRTRELSKSLDDLRTAQDRLVQTEKLASLGQLTAGIAHEIKNPLNFVNNFAALSAELTDELKDVLKPAVLDETIRAEVDEVTGLLKDNLTKVVQHGKRADSIVKNMLLHSREGSGEHRPADVNALVDESLNLAYHGARAERPQFNVTLQRDYDPQAGTADVFPQEITRVLLNLISNGFYAVTKRKADNGGGDFEPQVTATTRGRDDHVEILIRDNGTGIPSEVKEKMFNPFFTTKPAGEGTGLGLSMSHDIIVKQHGGTIEVETEPGAFTEFRLVLPRTSLAKASGNQ